MAINPHIDPIGLSPASPSKPARLPSRRLFDPRNAWSVQGGRIAMAAVLLLLWEVGSGRWFDAFYFSRPSTILMFLAKELVDPGFYRDIGVTGMELAMGYVIGGVIGVALGILLARWAYVARLADPFLLAMNSVPRIAIAPMLIVWFGIGMASKVFLAATLVFFITFFNTLSGIRGVERALINVARIQGASEWQIFTKVMMPHASAWILTGLRMSLPFALVGVILGEFMVSSRGLGYRLNGYATGYNTTGAIAMILVMMLIMMALTAVADWVDRRLMAWRPSNTESSAAVKA
jgi:NitT/TauT family transport system permease protein